MFIEKLYDSTIKFPVFCLDLLVFIIDLLFGKRGLWVFL